MSDYRTSYKGVGEMLTSDFMVAAMRAKAEAVQERALAIAPDAPPIGVGYKEHFSVESGIKEARTRRAVGRVVNDSDHAIYVEFGGHNTPAHRTLGKALDAAK